MPFPYGYALGKAEDAEYQHRVLEATFGLLDHKETPVLAEWTELSDRPVRILQASQVEVEGKPDIAEAANEVTALRNYYHRWLEDHDGRSAVGLCGVPQRRFRGLIRFLEAYSRGEENADFEERAADMSLVQFIRYAVEDLKAFAYESRMCQKFGVTEGELHTWFWGQTSLGQLVRAVAARMGDTGDEATKTIAQGIAR